MLLPSALGSSPHPPVSVCGTGIYQTIAAFLDGPSMCFATLSSLRVTLSVCMGGLLPMRLTALAPVLPFPAHTSFPCPHSSVGIWCRNIHLLSIGYAFPPGLRPRLPQGRSALPWIPWIFGLGDSHPHLATHSGILSSQQSTTPYGMASARCQCSPTNHLKAIPELRCRV